MAESVQQTLQVQVCWALPHGQVQECSVQLPQGATIAHALQASGWQGRDDQTCGVWGRVRERTQVLQAGDRVEVYQPLKVDPKVARRERFVQQGARGAGLFASRRAHSKAGY